MRHQDPPPWQAGTRSRHGRPRLHRVYFALAAFDILTVTLGLVLIDHLMKTHSQSVHVNQVWANRMNDYSDLTHLAAAVNAPGNDVFASGAVEQEAERFAAARERFDAKAAAVRADLQQIDDAEARRELLATLDEMDTTMSRLVAEASLIFSYFLDGDPVSAGEHMAAMDRSTGQINSTLARLGQEVRAIQSTHFDAQVAAAARLQRFEYLLAGLILVMVAAVTFYGVTLTRRMRQTADQIDQNLASLTRSEATVRAIVETARDGIMTIASDGTIKMVNSAAAEMFGYEPQQLAGRKASVLVPALDPNGAEDDPQAGPAPPGLTASEHEVVGRRQDGQTFLVELAVSESGLGSDRFSTWIVRDITERRKTEQELARYREQLETLVRVRTEELEASHEQLRQADRLVSIGTLAAGLGHDMNNVLFPIRCRLDVLEATDLDPKTRQELESVRQSVEYLQKLSEGLRLLALDPEDPGFAGGITELQPWWTETEPLLRSVLPSHATLTGELAADLPPLAVAQHWLSQAMLNLLVNAGEAIDEGGVVRVWAESLGDQRYVRLGVTDDGHGMTDEVRRHALDPFFTTKQRGMSTGLGLALVHGMAQSAGGSVEIDSARERGTTVVLTLPVAETERPPTRPAAEPRRTAIVSLPDPRVSAFVAAVLDSVGYEVRYGNGDGADAASALLWVTVASPGTLETARRFLNASSTRRVIAFGSPSEDWQALGATVVEETAGLDTIRKAIGLTATAAPERAS